MSHAAHGHYRTTQNWQPSAERQAFHKPHTSIGAAGHWVKTAGILAPLLIPEIVKDEGRRWRWIRISSVATALLSEALWTHRVRRERDEAREHHCASLAP